MNGIRRLCGTVLAMEAVILGLAILPAIRLEHANGPLAGGVGGGLAVCALLLSGMVGRPHMSWAVRPAPSCRSCSSPRESSCRPCTSSA